MCKAAIPITVGPIPEKEFGAFLRKKSLIGKRTIGEEALHIIFEVTDLVTGNTQQLCEARWCMTTCRDSITADDLTRVFH